MSKSSRLQCHSKTTNIHVLRSWLCLKLLFARVSVSFEPLSPTERPGAYYNWIVCRSVRFFEFPYSLHSKCILIQYIFPSHAVILSFGRFKTEKKYTEADSLTGQCKSSYIIKVPFHGVTWSILVPVIGRIES